MRFCAPHRSATAPSTGAATATIRLDAELAMPRRSVLSVGALPAFLVVFIILAVPESERWKRSVTNQSSRPIREIIAAGLLPRSLLAIVFASVALIGTWGSVQWLPLWADKLAQERYKAHIQAAAADLAPAQPMASEASQRSNARARQEADAAKATTQMLQAIGAILGCLIAPWIGARLGRRVAFFLLCLSSLALCWFMFKFVSSFGAGFLTLALFVSMATASFYGWFPLYFPELFPTRVRATGQGLCYNFGRVFAAGGALVQGQLVAYFDGSYARAGAVVTLIYLVGMVMIWLAPETKGKPLPE